MTVSWPADTKLFVRRTTATRKGHSAQIDARLLITVHVGLANFRRPDQPAETPQQYWLKLTDALARPRCRYGPTTSPPPGGRGTATTRLPVGVTPGK